MQQHGTKYFACRPPPPPTPEPEYGVDRSKCNCLEQGHVVYQIKGIHKCTNMAANILPADPHYPLPSWG